MIFLYVQPMFIGTTELMLVAGIALLLFGGKKLPEMMRGMGRGVKEFKEGMNEPITTPAPDQEVSVSNEDTAQDIEEATKE